MKKLLYLIVGGVFLLLVLNSCGGGSGGSASTEPQIEVTYPESGEIVARAKDINSNDKMDYYKTKIVNNIKGYSSEFIVNDNKLDELVAENTRMVFSDNPDKTINYAFYVDDILQFEETNQARKSTQTQRSSQLHVKKLLTDSECSAIQEDLKNQFLKVKNEVVSDSNQTRLITLYALRDWGGKLSEEDSKEVKTIITNAIITMIIVYPDYHELVLKYTRGCTEASKTDVSENGWIRPKVNFNFIFDINQDVKQMHDKIYKASLCPGWYDKAGLLAFDNTHCKYENNLLTWESTEYNKGYNYDTSIYYDGDVENFIHKYGETATYSKDRTYSLDIYFHDNHMPSSIKVSHITDGTIFRESYDESGKLIQACKENNSICTRY